jgi:nitrous oxidase accessory protein NosD
LAFRASSRAYDPVDTLIEKAIKDWYSEVSNAVQADINKCCQSLSGKTVGHFTQVVTDRAIELGCAIATYTEKQLKTSLIACNYAFTNIKGFKVYVSGKTASGCSTGINPDYPALCSANEPIKAEI